MRKIYAIMSANVVPCLILLWFCAEPATSATIGATTVSPTVINIGTPTPVTVTAQITDSSLIPNSVNLLRLNPPGMPTILGQLRDAGDHLFTVQVPFNEPSAGQIRLQVSAAFRGQLVRSLSSVLVVNVWPAVVEPSLGVTINHPPTWKVQPESDPSIVDISNVSKLSPVGDLGADKESLFHLRLIRNANPQLLSIDRWFDQYFAEGFDNPPLSRSNVLVAGRSAVRIEIYEIGKTAHYYVPVDSDVIELSYDLDNPSFISQYESMLKSIKFNR